METEEIRQRCIQLIADLRKISPDSIGPSSTFDELGMDSLDRMTLAFDVEEAYNISIPESALSTIRSVDQMVTGIQAALIVKNGSTETSHA